MQFRSVAGIARFIHSLLPTGKSLSRIQAVLLPSHYLDKPDDKPKCKGFAFITLSAVEDAEFLLSTWPWSREPSEQVFETPALQEALKFGFRMLSKTRYDDLKNEYLTCRTSLVEQTVRGQNGQPTKPIARADYTPTKKLPSDDLTPSYPVDCLIFARNIHLETNKTTLKNLFGHAFQTAPFDTNGVDYVDYNKGLDAVSCLPSSPLQLTLRSATYALLRQNIQISY